MLTISFLWDLISKNSLPSKNISTSHPASKDLGDFHYFLGLEILQTASGIHLAQRKYALKILASAVSLDPSQFYALKILGSQNFS